MKVCPACGYRDGIYWRPRHFDTSIDIARIEDVEKMSPIVGEVLKKLGPRQQIEDNHYVYRMTISGMVWRKEKEFWKSEGWSIPSDGSGSPKSAKFKRAISKRKKVMSEIDLVDMSKGLEDGPENDP